LTTTVLFVLLFFLVLLSLALNILLIVYGLRIRGQLLGLRGTVRHMLSEAITDLGDFGDLSLRYDIPVKDSLPVKAHIPLREQMNISVKGSIPVKQTVQTTVTVTAAPFGIKAPLAVEVPLDINVPINQAYFICFSIFAQLSRRPMVRLKTRRSGVESTGSGV